MIYIQNVNLDWYLSIFAVCQVMVINVKLNEEISVFYWHVEFLSLYVYVYSNSKDLCIIRMN